MEADIEMEKSPPEISYYIQSDVYGLTFVGIAYKLVDWDFGSKSGHVVPVATAVSGSAQKVRSMLEKKVKKLNAG